MDSPIGWLWLTTAPNPRSPATGHNAGQRGWKLHAVRAGDALAMCAARRTPTLIFRSPTRCARNGLGAPLVKDAPVIDGTLADEKRRPNLALYASKGSSSTVSIIRDHITSLRHCGGFRLRRGGDEGRVGRGLKKRLRRGHETGTVGCLDAPEPHRRILKRTPSRRPQLPSRSSRRGRRPLRDRRQAFVLGSSRRTYRLGGNLASRSQFGGRLRVVSPCPTPRSELKDIGPFKIRAWLPTIQNRAV